jgi:hypothetical protein
MHRLLMVICVLALSPALVWAQAEVAPKEEHQAGEGHVFAVPAMDHFHEVLHPLVHDAMPEKQYDLVRGKLDELFSHAKAIRKAKLPAEMASVKKEFRRSAERLVDQIRKLKKTSNDAKFEALFDEMHMTFEGMVGLGSGHGKE